MTVIRSALNVFLLSITIYVVGTAAVALDEEVKINPNAVEDLNYRLTDDVLPSHYRLKITPYFEHEGANRAFTFDGEVEITLRATKANINAIVLHAFDLTIASYSFNGGQSITYNASHYNENYNKWTIPIPTNLNGGILSNTVDTILKIQYVGYMKDDMYGFYRSYYYENGKKVWLGTTQFQPDHARRAFPCFDEPGIKAQFSITIVRPSNVVSSISNTKLVSSTCVNNKCSDLFQTTPRMSTYLIAFIVSDYKGSAENTQKFGVFARPEAQAHTDYAVEFGIKMLDKLTEYFGIDYYSTLDKMDMAAIPDFSAGAMENWGLLTYRETLILYDADTTPTLSQQRIAAVITHEQLHQWFGDLVTCKWWSETWMNEAFARYFQFMGTAFIYEDWNLEEQFVIENLQQSMQLDSTDSTHPMTNVVNTKGESASIFDNISYNKGASILRWLSYYIGHDAFRNVLSFHIDSHKHQAVVPSDFFSAIANKSSETASKFFESWTTQSGFPLVTASVEGNKLKLSQKRFMRSNGIDNNKTELYNIPISLAVDGSGYDNPLTHRYYFTQLSEEFTLDKTPEDYYMLNVQQTGFYRVHYSDENWQKIGAALASDDFNKIHVLNRAQVIDDLLHLARVGIVEYSKAVNIVRYLKKETDYIPWYAAINQGFLYLSQRLQSKDFDIFSWFINDLMENVYQHLTFEPKVNDSRTDIYNRNNILTWLCKFGHEECVEKSKSAFANYVDAYKKVSKDHRVLVYCNAVRYGGNEEFDFLFERFLNENVAAEQLNILNALGCSKDEKNIKKLLSRLIRTDDIRPQDRNTVINAILNSNLEGVNFLFNFVTENYNDWRKTIGSLGTLTTLVGRFTEQSQLTKFEAFLEQEKSGLGELHESLSKAVETAKANFAWDEKYMKDFVDHLHVLNSAVAKMISISMAAFALLLLFFLN